jgi:hypothetical protein
MKTVKTLYWIDDDHDQNAHRTPKGASKRAIEDGLNVHLQAMQFKSHKDYAEFIANLPESKTYGVLMDYKLTNVGALEGSEYGTTWAAQLRALKPSIPVVGVSLENEKEVPRFRMENFLAFFSRKVFLHGKPPLLELKALLEGYSTIWRAMTKGNSKTGLELMIKLVKPPEGAEELLRVALPPALRGSFDDETPHAASRWIWHQFQGEPGFLFDELETATFLGITKEAFLERAADAFADARYTGALACKDRPRWWVCQLRGAAEKQVGQDLVGPVAQSRDKLLLSFGIQKEKIGALFAKTYGRHGYCQPPECVSFKDQDSKNERRLNERVPALLKDTLIDEVDANPPFGFQARRHFKLDETE